MQVVCQCVLLLLSCFLISFVGSSENKKHRQFRHDYEFDGEANGWFKFHEIPATWESASMKCLYEGAVLASPITEKFHRAMQKIMDGYFTNIFTGTQSLTSTGDYFSLEGVHLMDMPIQWAPGEPNNLGDKERCLAMKPDGTVLDVPCSEPRPYICYKNKTKDLVMNTCGTTDKEYVEVTPGHCYKYHPSCEDWQHAHKICSSEGGHLAVINSESEAQTIYKLFASKTHGCTYVYFHLGFRNPVEQMKGFSNWITLQGETLEEAGYAKWGAKEPNNKGGNENCGSGYYEQNAISLNDIQCSFEKLPFICEIDVPCKTFTGPDKKY